MTRDPLVSLGVEALEQRFDDPWDEKNPVGFAAILAADENAELLEAGEQLLDAYGLSAEFVPSEHGGRLTRLDRLIEIMRAVFRRDPCLGLGYGASSLIAAVNVWTAGRPEQRHAVADLLLRQRKLACGYYELAHGNDLARVDFEAMPDGEGLRLSGGKQVISNIQRADAVVCFARTQPGAGSRNHSILLIDKALLPPDRMTYRPRFFTVGMRGVQLGGIDVRDCPIPAQSVLGATGHGIETALKSFQVTRVALPGMFMGILDTALRLTLCYALERKLYGRAVSDLPQTRSVLADTFADLLLCDCFTTVVARSVHVLPREASVNTSAVKYLVPRILMDAMNRLSAIMGAHFYLRQGRHALFQKLLRDIQPAGFGHLARVAGQMTILPQLPLLARRAWLSADAAPPETFRIDAELSALPFAQLSLSGGGRDHLSGALIAGLEQVSGEGGPEHLEIRRRIEGFVAELRKLKQECAELPPRELTAMASPHSYDLTTRYTAVLAASACLNVWQHNRDWSPFLSEPTWLLAALHRLEVWQGRTSGPLPESLRTRLFTELFDRVASDRGLDLTSRHIASWHKRIPPDVFLRSERRP